MSFDLKIFNGDISLSNDGSLDLVFDNKKLKQDILKILLTKKGENKFFPDYGSLIGTLTIGSIIDESMVKLDLEASIIEAINLLTKLQNFQMKKQYLTPGEIIVDVLDVSALRDEVDPRLYNIFFTILTQKLTSITDSVTIRLI